MKLAPVATAFALSALAMPAHAVTLDNGVVLITQADALMGNVTPGDTAGFPITLSVSGSYRLASNLAISSAVNGIEVTAPEVTIDFAGFRMAGSGVGVTGITSNQRALSVKGGTIRGFTSNGISAGEYLTVDRMRVVDNFSSGIGATDFTTMKNSNVSRNLGSGVSCFKYCRIESTLLTNNGYFGAVFVEVGGVMLGNTISNNGSPVRAFKPASAGNNTIVGNNFASSGTILPLDPNQPPPPP